jgi:DNA helicase-2/ATP-dependent DNA helicase PcrA
VLENAEISQCGDDYTGGVVTAPNTRISSKTPANQAENPLFSGLTDVQRQAVAHIDGPLLVLAGPGSGKTTVVTRRVANLIAHGIPPWQILALTFTNKAAGEMRDRIMKLLPENLPGVRGLTVATFHSFCARLLRRYAAAAKLSQRFTIYDSGDSRDAIKLALKEAGMDSKNWTPGSVAHAISGAKNYLMDAAAYASHASDFHTRSIAKVFAIYEKILKKNDALDFDDLLLVTAKLLRNNEEVRRELQQRFQYILIDEYQDTNHAQFVIAHALAANHQNICVVGDPDQSIYGWRGADIQNILEFEKHYPKATTIPLGQNFRSTAHIVETAAKLIENNRKRKKKRLHTDLGEGEKPTLITCFDEHHEAQLIVERFRELNGGEGSRARGEPDSLSPLGERAGVRGSGAHGSLDETGGARSLTPNPSPSQQQQGRGESVPWREMAVLYRINALSRVLEEAFRSANIPYVIARGTAFYERKEVKDALSYLRIVANPNDEVSLRRIINTPTRGIGNTTLDKIEIHAINRQLSLFDALGEGSRSGDVGGRASGAILKFVSMMEGWREAASGPVGSGALINDESKPPLARLVERIVQESGLEAMYRKSKLEEDIDRVENLNELINAAAEFVPPQDEEGQRGAARDGIATGASTLDTLNAFLESVALVSDADAIDPANGAVTLMTLHAAKGLEFEAVAIAGLEEGLLPHSRSTVSDDDLEEERRLLFVGITRAKRHLMLTHAQMRTNRGLRERTMPSHFLRELPPGQIEIQNIAGQGMDDGRDDFGDDIEWGRSSWDAAGRQRRSPDKDVLAAGGKPSYSSHSARAKPQAATEIPFPIGCIVEHPKFGLGKVEAFTPRVSGSSVQVVFNSVGRKTLIVEFAKLQRVD